MILPMEVNTDRARCSKCGKAFSKYKGNFPVSYAAMYKGLGYIPVCKECLDKLYRKYLSECNDTETAVRQVCRKLDLYWDEELFKIAVVKSSTKSVITNYITKTNSLSYAGRCYDDTLEKEGTLWTFGLSQKSNHSSAGHTSATSPESVSEDVVNFWGTGYTPEMYVELEKRYSYWLSKFPKDADIDIGTEALLKQVCSMEMDISRDRSQGKSVDKSVTVLNNLLGSLNFKPSQRQSGDIDSDVLTNPLGVWIRRWEHERPLPEVDDDLKDVNHLLKYFFTWLGHVFKMLNKKNGFTKMYEEEIERLRIEKPEFADEDDEDFLMDVLEGYDDSGGDEDDEI